MEASQLWIPFSENSREKSATRRRGFSRLKGIVLKLRSDVVTSKTELGKTMMDGKTAAAEVEAVAEVKEKEWRRSEMW